MWVKLIIKFRSAASKTLCVAEGRSAAEVRSVLKSVLFLFARIRNSIFTYLTDCARQG